MTTPMIQIGRYRGTPVAQGGFATVHRVTLPDSDTPLALKWASADAGSDIAASLLHEYSVLAELSAPCVPRAHDLGWGEGRPYFVTDWVGGAPLWDLQGVDDPALFRLVLREATKALLFIHGRGWVHGDLKPDNFRWDRCSIADGSPTLHVLDFGLARPIGDLDRPRGAGTVGYLAPEFLQLQPADARADWYAVGVILYEWLFGVRPFAADDPADEVAAHLESEPDFDRPKRHSTPDWAVDVIERLMQKSPDARGATEYDIVKFLCENDPELSFDDILLEQLENHAESEDLRLSGEEHLLVRGIVQSITGDSPLARWRITADPLTRARIQRQLSIEIPRAKTHMNARDTASETGTDRWVPIEFLTPAESSIIPQTDEVATAHVVTLPWTPDRVATYLRSITGDEGLSTRWTRPVMRATSGLPSLVSDLLRFAIQNQLIEREDGAWDFSSDALSIWTGRTETLDLFAEYLGDLTSDERRVCDHLAIGRGYAQIDILSERWPHSAERFRSAFDRLRQRGVIVPSNSRDFFDWRLRLGALAECWRSQVPSATRRQIALGLGTAIESCSIPFDTQVSEILAELFADSRSWDKCVHYSVSAVTAHIKAGRQDQAPPYIALAISASGEIPPGRTQQYWSGRAQMALGDFQKASGQIDEALRTYRTLLRLGRGSNDRRLLAETLKDLGDLYRQMRQFEKGIRVLRRARQLYEGMNDRTEVALTLNNLGNMYWVAADYEEAAKYYREALTIARELVDQRIEALALSNLGVAYKSNHDYLQAEACYQESLAIKEQLDSPTDTALTLNNLGVIALDQGRLVAAEDYFNRAIDLNRIGGAEAEVVFNHGNLVQVHLERGDLRRAITLGEATIIEADDLGDPATGAELRAFMAEAYLRAGDFGVAGQLLEDARRVATGQTNDDLRAHLALVAALRAYRLGHLDTAIRLLDDAESAFTRAEMPRLRADAIVLRLNIAVAKDDPDTTASWWRKGQMVAGMASARHKVAQLAFARLPADPARGFPREAMVLIDSFLEEEARWQWTGEYRIWQARYFMTRGDLGAAEETANLSVAQLREDGNWESLWRALAVLGSVCQKRTDYEPALAAFEEAERIVHVISNTIDDEGTKSSYLSDPLARVVTAGKSHIIQMTS